MTTPGGDGTFEYTDDSVIARVSVDVPSQALTDINQLAEAMGAMRTQLAAVAEAQEKWLEFLNQMPKVTRDTNDAIKDQITLLERQTYLQGELGGGRGGVFSADVSGGGGGGGGYSTAAQPGYAQPWEQGTPGTGFTPPAPQQIAEKYQRIQAENPGLEANMQSSRGAAVNPALLTGVGAAAAAIANKFGRGKADPGNASPQPTGGDRDSSAPPDPTQGGVPSTSTNQNTPGDPNPDDTEDAKKDTLLTQLVNEFRGGKNGRAQRIAGTLLSAVGRQVGSAVLGGGSSGGGGGGISGVVGRVLGSPAAKAAGAVGLGALAFNKAQDLGEKYTEYQGLGSVQGGDAMTGMKYEAQARIMGLNPFITTQQARESMQKALKEGFRGENYDTVNDFMIENFKELGISMGQSMDLMKASVKGLGENDSQAGVKKDLDETLNTMKELSAEGGLSFPERVNQLQELKEQMASQGFSPENANRTALGLQEGYGDSMALRDSIGNISSQVSGSPMLMTLAAQKAGITGILPNALGLALDAKGMDGDEILESAASQVAQQVSGHGEYFNRVAGFQMLMLQFGVSEMEDIQKAKALYDKVTGGGEKPTEKANRTVARQGNTDTRRGQTSSSPADENWTKQHSNYTPSDNAAGAAENFDKAGRGGGNFAPTGNAPAAMPTTGQPVPSFSSNGTVSGTVTITVDQAGRVTAPPTIQLTGQQKSALAGYSSAQLNNAPPGDPTYNHSYNTFPTGPGGGG
jgi:hypothetical protein